jgi:flagellar hook-length control protein FliK
LDRGSRTAVAAKGKTESKSEIVARSEDLDHGDVGECDAQPGKEAKESNEKDENVTIAALPDASTDPKAVTDPPIDADALPGQAALPETTPEMTVQPAIPVAAAPPQVPLAGSPGIASGSEATVQSAPDAPVAPPLTGKPQDIKGAERPSRPQVATKNDADGEASSTDASISADASPAPEISDADSEQPNGKQSARPVSRHAGVDLPHRIASGHILPPQQQAEPNAPPQPNSDASTRPEPNLAANDQLPADADATPPPRTDADTGAAPKSGHDGSGSGAAAIKATEMAVQTLAPSAATTPGASAPGATTNAAPPAAASAANPMPTIPVPLAGVAVEIAAMAQAGRHRFEIRLDPPELGRIDVRLDVDRDGNVTSRMTVERAETLDLLKRDAVQLERALQHAGLKTSDHALEFSLRHHAFARDEQPSQAAARMVLSEDDPTPLEAARQGYGRLLGLGGGLDIRV